jgi:hypothetical protein
MASYDEPRERADENRRDSIPPGGSRSEATLEMLEVAGALGSPTGVLAQTLTMVEGAVLRRQAAARFGRRYDVIADELDAATAACVVLDGALEDVSPYMRSLGKELIEHQIVLGSVFTAGNQVAAEDVLLGPDMPRERSYRQAESRLLQLAGLSEQLARKHVDASLESLVRGGASMNADMNFTDTVMGRLERGRDAVCAYAAELVRREEMRVSRRRLRLVGRVLGGFLVTTVNAVAVPFTGPLFAAVSSIAGATAAAVDRIVDEIDD